MKTQVEIKSRENSHKKSHQNNRDLKYIIIRDQTEQREFTSLKIINEYRRIGEEVMKALN